MKSSACYTSCSETVGYKGAREWSDFVANSYESLQRQGIEKNTIINNIINDLASKGISKEAENARKSFDCLMGCAAITTREFTCQFLAGLPKQAVFPSVELVARILKENRVSMGVRKQASTYQDSKLYSFMHDKTWKEHCDGLFAAEQANAKEKGDKAKEDEIKDKKTNFEENYEVFKNFHSQYNS